MYCTKTHFGQDAQVDTSVENMQTCSCGDVCNSEKCECVALSEKVYYNAEGLLSVSVALNNEKCQVPGYPKFYHQKEIKEFVSYI